MALDPSGSRDDSELGLPKSARASVHCTRAPETQSLLRATACAGTVQKMFKELLGPDVRCTNEAHNLLHTCLNGAPRDATRLSSALVPADLTSPLHLSHRAEFLQNLTAQANGVSSGEGKNTITEAHLLKALKDLDFQHYASQLESAQPAEKPPPRKKGKAKDSGLSDEELLRMQQALFAESKQKMEQASSGASSSQT